MMCRCRVKYVSPTIDMLSQLGCMATHPDIMYDGVYSEAEGETVKVKVYFIYSVYRVLYQVLQLSNYVETGFVIPATVHLHINRDVHVRGI